MEYQNEKETRIMNVLEFIGLHKNERIIYLDLLKNGASTAVDISKRTRIHRPNTYDALRKLIDRGFISQTKTPLKNLFQAMEVERIRHYIDQKKQEIEEIIPEIHELSRKVTQKEDILITKGTFGAREALLDLLKQKKEIKVFGSSKQAVEVIGMGFLRDFHKERIKMKIKMLHIYNIDAADRIKHLNRLKYTQARHLSRDYDSIITTLICGDTVLIFVYGQSISVITIKQQEIADTYSRYFDVMWKQTR